MAYEIEFTVNGDIIEATVFIDRTAGGWNDSLRKMWARIAEKCRQEKRTKILLLSRAMGDPKEYDARGVYSSFKDLGMDPAWRIAVAIRHNTKAFKFHLAVVDAILYNHGFKHTRTFATEAEARKWLG